ncbi:GNAT family N-acetyltransferase [Streptomyces sp. NRRL WC-3742]|uniref:GNAT family N-acetyltransferase n=1 Tax=Streptomyces sp. NRRL WC-3742 TaxID=1463934 RepID=UPI0004C9A7E8|nr:GNAT family N-acetyltransferase [Streptomyces sp. NRRL WC-3742]
MGVELRYYGELAGQVREDLLEVYADVRGPLLHLANYSVEAFGERLDRSAGESGFGLVLGYEGGVVVGYACGNRVGAGDRYWGRMAEPLPEGFTDEPVLALREIGVRSGWRGTGVARRIHDRLLAGREEGRVLLMVNPLAGDGKVQAVYEGWGYRAVNGQAATAESPRLVVMMREC